jgi:hypothetical protein
MFVGSDDSESLDLALYYCTCCDSRHEVGSDAPPFVCGIKYSVDKESIDNHGDIIPISAARLARYQVCVTFDPETGAEVPAGGDIAHTNNDRQRDGEANGNNTDTTILVSQTKWDASQNCVRLVKDQA